MGAPCQNACTPWATADDIDSAACAALDADLIEGMLAVASDVLFELSARRFAGSCQDVIRPEPAQYGCHKEGRFIPQFRLPAYPVTSITQVKIDGVVLDPSAYRLDEHRYLVRVDGEDWPTSQDLTLETTEVDTWEITFVYGSMPPPAGVKAAAALACQLALAATDSDDCQLPERVSSVTREGMTIAILDPFEFLDQGKTGIYLVDLFLRAYNPHGQKRPAAIWSPELDSSRYAGT